MLHRPDTVDIDVPSHTISFPELYINFAALSDARKTSNVPSGSRVRNTQASFLVVYPLPYDLK